MGPKTGDPAKAALAMITAIESPEPPFMLVLGASAQKQFRAACEARLAELDAWAEVTSDTDFAAGLT